MNKTEKGSYKWLVLFVGVVSQSLTFGISFGVGVLYKDWISYFNSTASFLSLVSSAPTAVACLLGPLFGYLLSNFSFRLCGFFGGFVMAIGMSASSFVDSPFQLFFTFGILAGFGMGLHFYVSCAMVNEYFFENRLFAEGIAGSGMGLGTFGFSILQQYLSNNYSWKGAILISGGIVFHLCLNSMFYIAPSAIGLNPLNKICSWRKHNKKDISGKGKRIPFQFSTDQASSSDGKNQKPQKSEEKNFLKRSLILGKNPLFLMIFFSDALTWLAIFIPYVHLVERGRLIEGVDANTAAWLSSALGLSSIIGRPCTGFIANYFHIHPLRAFFANQMVSGISMIVSSFWSSLKGLFTFGILFGFLSNGYGFMKASTAAVLGAEWFADAYSWMLFIEGVGILLGPIFAGYIYDISNSYAWSFRVGGLLIVLSACVCFLKPFAEKLHTKSLSPKSNMTSKASVIYIGKENDNFQP